MNVQGFHQQYLTALRSTMSSVCNTCNAAVVWLHKVLRWSQMQLSTLHLLSTYVRRLAICHMRWFNCHVKCSRQDCQINFCWQFHQVFSLYMIYVNKVHASIYLLKVLVSAGSAISCICGRGWGERQYGHAGWSCGQYNSSIGPHKN